MKDDHLVNVILYFKKKCEDLREFGLPILPINGKEVSEWMNIFENELKFRKLYEKGI